MTGRARKAKGILAISLSVFFTFLFVAVAATGSTTIGTSISTDGTLTVGGNTNLAAGTFFVDSSNNRVGIGTTSPTAPFHVEINNSSNFEIARFINWNTGSNQDAGYISFPRSSDITRGLLIGHQITENEAGNFSTIDAKGGVSESISIQAGLDNSSNRGDISLQKNGGNVGIGTTSPYAKLSVVGEIVSSYFTATSTTATSTAANGWNITSGCFAVNGVCVSGGGGGSGTVGSATIAGQMPYYASSGTTLTATSSLFLAPSGNFGIGTTSPAFNLDVSASKKAQMRVISASSTSYARIWYTLGDGASAGQKWNVGVRGADDFDNMFAFETNTGPGSYVKRMVITKDGKVGIDTTSPYAKLSVWSDNPSDGTASSSVFNIIDSASTTMFTVLENGRVGIGTTSPDVKLSVAGSARVFGEIRAYRPGAGYSAVGARVDGDTEWRWVTHASGQIYWGDGTNALDTTLYRDSADKLRTPDTLIVDTGIGVGTTTPGAKLSVDANSGTIAKFEWSADSGARNGFALNNKYDRDVGIAFQNQGVTKWQIYNNAPSATSNNNLYIVTSGGKGIVIEQGTGNVGVGTTSPNAKLDVENGNIEVSNGYGIGTYGYPATLALLNGNVGIGTSSPYAKLSIAGKAVMESFHATSTTATSTVSGNLHVLNNLQVGSGSAYIFGNATSTFSQGIDISAGCFAVNGVCLDPAAFGTVNTGSIGQIPYYAADGTTLTATSNIFLDTNGNFGVGTTSPYAKLSVAGFINTDQYSGFKQAGNTILYASSTNSSVAVGIGAGQANTSTGGFLTAVGHEALYTNDTGSNNTAVGYQSLYTNGSGSNNTAVGHRTLYLNVSGSYNSAFGYYSLYFNTGTGNSAFGYSTLYANEGGAYNSAVGYQALSSNTNGGYNSAVGYQALQGKTTATGNSALGYQALANYNTGSYNTAVGYQAILKTNGGSYNTGMGYASLAGWLTGSGNVGIGYQAGNEITSGSYNTIIGYDVDAPSATADNQLNIGNLIFGTNVDGRGTTLSSGNVGIGTTTPYARLSVVGETVSSYFTATSTTATSTAANGWNITSGCFAVNGVCLDPAAFGTVNTGSIGQIPYYAADGTTLTATSNIFLDTNGNFGVGTTSPYAKLSVAGFINTDQYSGFKQAGNTILYASSTNQSTMVGIGAGAVNETGGTNNTAVGYQSLNLNSTGNRNTAVGSLALQSNDVGYGNTAAGHQSLNANTGGDWNVAVGYQSLYSNSSGNYNVAVGSNALYSNNNGFNTAVGFQAIKSNTGGYNSALGRNALGGAGGSGNYNTAIGTEAIGFTSAGASNTALGYRALYILGSAGNGNIGIGWNAGNSISSGDYNIVIGYDVDAPSATGDNQLNIGNLIYGTGLGTGTTLSSGNVGIGTTTPYARLSVVGETVSSYFTATSTTATSTLAGGLSVSGGIALANAPGSKLYFSNTKYLYKNSGGNIALRMGTGAGRALVIEDSSGTVRIKLNGDGGEGGNSYINQATPAYFGIGTSSPAYTLHVGNSIAGAVAGFTNSSGTCTINPTNTALSCASDISLKKDVEKISDSLALISALEGVSFHWKSETPSAEKHIGFIAQEVEKVLPQLVSVGPDGKKAVNYLGFSPVIIEAVKELNLKVSELEAATASTTGISGGSFAFSTVLEWFGDIGIRITDGVVSAKEFIADKIAAKEVKTDKVITKFFEMEDEDGNIWCVSIGKGGVWKKVQGQCGEAQVIQIISGCADASALNYDSSATEDDGSCEYSETETATSTPSTASSTPQSTETSSTAPATDSEATSTPPAPEPEPVYGCADETALNYNAEANRDDGSCEYPVLGCVNPEADNYDSAAAEDDGSCVISGCLDSEAENYNPDANQTDDSCSYPAPAPETASSTPPTDDSTATTTDESL